MATRKKRSVKDYFFAHRGNLYKPYIFAAESVMAMILVLFIFEGLYVFQIGVVTKDAGFTAAVLPAVLTTLTNEDRVASGLGQLQEDPLLNQAAQEKAQDMLTYGYFAHVSPTGKDPWYWLDQMGYKYDYAGENLAVDFTDSADVETAWMQSPSHRDNIVKPEYTHIGIATVQGMYQGRYVTFVVEVFATPSAVSAISDIPIASDTTPVVVADADSTQTADTSGVAKQDNRILGVQKEAAAAAPVAAAALQQSAPAVRHAPQANPLVQAAASPANVFQNVLIAFIMVIVSLLGIALMVHVRMGIQYVEIIGSSAVLVGVAAVLLFFNGKHIHPVHLPADGQSASIAMALR